MASRNPSEPPVRSGPDHRRAPAPAAPPRIADRDHFGVGWRARLRHLRYLGRRLRCPICAATCRRFRPGGATNATIEALRIVGAGFEHDHRCPVCKARSRERLVFAWLLHRGRLFDAPAAPTDRIRVLHVAPERALGRAIRRLAHVDYLSADLDSPAAMERMDITAIAHPDASFDVIVCNHVLEHVPDEERAMRELRRVLAPGGYAVLQVPIGRELERTLEDPTVDAAADRERLYGQSDHVRLHAMADYVRHLEDAGFDVECFDWRADRRFGSPADNVHALTPGEPVFVARPSRVSSPA